jgi:hypothetical protein
MLFLPVLLKKWNNCKLIMILNHNIIAKLPLEIAKCCYNCDSSGILAKEKI